MRKFATLVLLFAVLGIAVAYNSGKNLLNEEMISQQTKVKDLETYKVTYFKEGKVFARVSPKISKKEGLANYVAERRKAIEFLSAKRPSRLVYITVTFNKPLSVEEFKNFLKKYNLEAMNYMYKSYPEGIGVFSTDVPDSLIADMENKLKEKYGNEFRLIGDIVSFKTVMPARNLTKLQSDVRVFLVDPGPLEVYLDNPHSEVIAAVDYIYTSYEALWKNS